MEEGGLQDDTNCSESSAEGDDEDEDNRGLATEPTTNSGGWTTRKSGNDPFRRRPWTVEEVVVWGRRCEVGVVGGSQSQMRRWRGRVEAVERLMQRAKGLECEG